MVDVLNRGLGREAFLSGLGDEEAGEALREMLGVE